MTLIEFIGFIITMIAFFIIVAKQARDDRRRRKHPEEFEQELEVQQAQINEMLESLGVKVEKEMEEEELEDEFATDSSILQEEYPSADENRQYVEVQRERAVGGIKRPPLYNKGKKESLFVDFHTKMEIAPSFVHERAYEQKKLQQSQLQKTLGNVESLKQAVILREILGPPKGLVYKDERF